MSSSDVTEVETKPGNSVEVTNREREGDTTTQENSTTEPAEYVAEKKDLRFWLIVASLGVTALLAGIDGTIISTTLPSISAALGGGEEYVWVSGSYFLATTALQPLYGQLANLTGRRVLLIFSIAVFILGSGICGGASSMNMLIAGRTVKGIGGAGITLLVELIICDLVPLRERGQYTSIIYSVSTIGSVLGPWMGGELVDKASWRWVFYINLPIGGAALVVVCLVLHVGRERVDTREAIRRIDFVGNFLFLGATIGIMFGLIYGGVKHPWDSWQIIVPLVLGGAGLIAFCAWESSPWCYEPAIPRQIVGNRTSVAALIISFLHSSLLVWVTYFVSVYFQVAKSHSAARTGVDLLPNTFGFMLAAIIAGVMLTKFGRYRPWHFGGQAMMVIGMGLYSLLDEKTPTYGWVLLVFFFAMGCGFVMPSLLPALQADLSDLDTAAATAAITIARSFGFVIGAFVPGIVFNNVFDRFAGRITDESTRNLLLNGQAFAHATQTFVLSLTEETRAQVVSAYVEALRYVWYAAIAVAVAGFLVVFVEREIDLRTTLNTEFGIEKGEKSKEGAAEAGEKSGETSEAS
ncbi:major facilitator superfamily-domain-containing protein [Coniochaeta sp. 2T2.1]|nr:major facilitator superfamily-domain-containing protein [Coniochaeta sp. 2T2.1]